MVDTTPYLDLPYTRELKTDEDGDIIARIVELPGCTTHGSTEAEALANLRQALIAWIEEALDNNLEIPRPASVLEREELPSGKWVQRVPRYIHARLVERAKAENTSLNSLVLGLIVEGLAKPRALVGVQSEQPPHPGWDPSPVSSYSLKTLTEPSTRFTEPLREQAQKFSAAQDERHREMCEPA